MDKSEYPSLPKLAQLHTRLASNSRRVEDVVDAQLDGIERLFSATTAEDWPAVVEATRYLASLQPDQICDDVIRTARQLCKELGHSSSSMKQPKHLASLLEVCRAARQRRAL